MENKIDVFSKYSYSENTIDTTLAENVIKIQNVRIVKTKILGLLEAAAIDDNLFRILSYYLNLNNERKSGEIINDQEIEYLGMLTLNLCNLLYKESSHSKDHLLLRLFIRLNFNKDQIIDYYINKINSLIESNPDNLEDILQCYLIESGYLIKKDTAYTSRNHPLGMEIQNHLKVVMSHQSRTNLANYRPIPRILTLKETTSVFMYGLNILVNTGILKVHSSYKVLFETLCKLIRDSKGDRLNPTTLKSRFNTYNLTTLLKTADLIDVIKDYNDFQIQLRYQRKK